MAEPHLIVIGGGPAGCGAAVVLARAGAKVLLIEQRDRLGGAVHRQPAGPHARPVPRAARHVRAWARLTAEMARHLDRLKVMSSCVFIGIDEAGRVLVDDRRAREVLGLRPDGLVLALGAVERIVPFPGWEQPGVLSAGGAQVLLKETGCAPPGETLVAGSGPLLLALAAQLCAAGRPPVAVLERGTPFARPFAAGNAALHSAEQIVEGMGYAARLATKRVPYLTGSHVLSCAAEGEKLRIIASVRGAERVFNARNLAVHDGVRPSTLGHRPGDAPFPVVEAGDGHEILGADAAVSDGERAAAMLGSRLGLKPLPEISERKLAAARRFQAALTTIFAAERPELPAETVLCRCENKRVGDLPDGVSPREVKLVHRFGMGVCQGRFCAEATARQLGGGASIGLFDSSVARWPTRPVSAGALARLKSGADALERIWNDDHPASR